MFFLSMLAWLPLCLLFLALYEYAGHRWPLHHTWFTKKLGLGGDHLAHHKRFIRQFEWAPEEPSWYDAYWARIAFGLAWSSLLMAPVAIWLSLPLAVTFVAAAGIHGGFWQFCHNQMHRPTCGWFTRLRYFRFIRQFHVIHHLKPRTNFGFVFAPFCDWALGTYRRENA